MTKVKKIFMVAIILTATVPVVSQAGGTQPLDGWEFEATYDGCSYFQLGLCK
ncbi:MAG: hypothetical protein QNK37_22760 [Acidobacteriota bacterium]|nr:hypothetical protein [Acidobacteriota bacterium]